MANIIIGKVAPVFKGEWSNTETYKRLDIVSYDGSSYACIAETNNGTTPASNSSVWVLVASKGDICSVDDLIYDAETNRTLRNKIESLNADLNYLEYNQSELFPTKEVKIVDHLSGNGVGNSQTVNVRKIKAGTEVTVVRDATNDYNYFELCAIDENGKRYKLVSRTPNSNVGDFDTPIQLPANIVKFKVEHILTIMFQSMEMLL